jgi:hypothetical protein
VAAIAAELVSRSRELTIRANQLEVEIRAIVRRLAPALLGRIVMVAIGQYRSKGGTTGSMARRR